MYLKTLEKTNIFRENMQIKKDRMTKLVRNIDAAKHFQKDVVPASIAKLSVDHKFLGLKKKFDH